MSPRLGLIGISENDMKTALTFFSMVLIVSTVARADVPSADPEQGMKRIAARVLHDVIADINAMEEIVVADGADKDKQIAAKAELQNKIESRIKAMDAKQRQMFQKMAADQEAYIAKQADEATDTAKKAELLGRLKPYKTLRERFLQAALDSDDGMAAAPKKEGTSAAMIIAGLAMAMAFASAGLLYMRKSAAND